MTIDKETSTEILRLHHAEKWKIGTIADQLGLHHSTVRRAIEDAGEPLHQRRRRSKLDPFIPFIEQILEDYPKLSASRLYEMVRARLPGEEPGTLPPRDRLHAPKASS